MTEGQLPEDKRMMHVVKFVTLKTGWLAGIALLVAGLKGKGGALK